MSGPPKADRVLRELPSFLELQNLGLNVPFALAFVLVAAGGVPPPVPFLLVVVAFVAARNAGHAFNRWADRRFDAANPRTAGRALPAGRLSGRFALVVAGASAVVVLFASALLNPLALALAPVALALVFGYSYTKRVTALSTAFLGLVQAIVPAAAFVALDARLPPATWLAVGAMLAWGTAFETIHSLGDLESDRELGLRSLPLTLGPKRSYWLVAILHGIALALFVAFGLASHLRLPYVVGIAGIAIGVAWSDLALSRGARSLSAGFRQHFAFAAIYLAGVAVALFLPV